MTSQKKKFVQNFWMKDEAWKGGIETEYKAVKNWEYRWGFLRDEYNDLKAKMIEQTAKSHTLKRITEQKDEDMRQLERYPSSVNHSYGYMASNPEMKLETLGPDHFKPLPIPAIYKIIK